MSADPARTLREARDAYFAAHLLPPDGGYGERWVKLRIGPLPFAFPNTGGRRRAVPFHDLHHVLTGYATDLVGEAEIAAWEIGSGCRHVRTALHLDLRVLGFLLPRRPRTLFRAFLRGRNSRNLYRARYDEALLARSVASAREELGLDRELPPARPADRRAFAGWAALALGLVWGPLVPLALLGWWLVAR